MQSETFILIREYLGLSQRDFADHIGASRSVVGLIESGHRKVSRSIAAKIAKKFEVTEDFLAFVENRKRLDYKEGHS